MSGSLAGSGRLFSIQILANLAAESGPPERVMIAIRARL